MIRRFFLFLSTCHGLRRWMETSAAARRMTHRFVAGETLDEELDVCARLARDGIFSTLDHLGENLTALEEAAAPRDAYLDALDRIAAQKLPSTVSIKPTQFGMDLSAAACCENVRQLVAKAKAVASRVEIDMESSDYAERTLALVHAMHREFGVVRAVIQAYLYRSATDIDELCAEGVPVRLCKGAYNEPADVAFPDKADVDRNYVALMKALLARGAYPAIATHDERIIKEALAFVRQNSVAADRFEFQMLYGIRRDLQRRLVADGWRLRVYVPYGTAWYSYFMRRLAERPANAVFLLRNLFR